MFHGPSLQGEVVDLMDAILRHRCRIQNLTAQSTATLNELGPYIRHGKKAVVDIVDMCKVELKALRQSQYIHIESLRLRCLR
jgi:hypothetical protein